MRSTHYSTLMLSAALVACGGDNDRTADVQMQIEDSAGVRIVQYAGVPEVEPPFVIAEEPVYRHGANPGDYTFQLVNVGRLFPDGSAVVADRDGEVVVLSPELAVLAGRSKSNLSRDTLKTMSQYGLGGIAAGRVAGRWCLRVPYDQVRLDVSLTGDEEWIPPAGVEPSLAGSRCGALAFRDHADRRASRRLRLARISDRSSGPPPPGADPTLGSYRGETSRPGSADRPGDVRLA